MKLLCMVGVIYAIAVAVYIFTETGKPLGSRDFHQFWYAGHFIIQERDPYETFFAKEPPNLPVHYVDGVTVNRYPVAQADLEITPSNTPAMLLMLTPFSYFSWETVQKGNTDPFDGYHCSNGRDPGGCRDQRRDAGQDHR